MEATKEFIRVVDDFVLINQQMNYHSPDDEVEKQFERLKTWVRLIPKVLRELREVESDGRCVTKFEAMVYSGDPAVRNAANVSDYWLDCRAELRQAILTANPRLRPTVSVAAAAKLMKVSTDTIERMVKRGELPEPHLPAGKKKGKVFFKDDLPK